MDPNILPEVNLMRIRAVMSRTAMSRSQIYNLVKQGKFPPSIKLNPDGTSVAWIESEVNKWIEERITAREEC